MTQPYPPTTAPLSDHPELCGLVHQLWDVRSARAQLEAINGSAKSWLRAYFAVNAAFDASRRPLAEQRTQLRPPYRKYDTKRLKRDQPAGYNRCRVLIPRHQVKPPVGTVIEPFHFANGKLGLPLPDVPRDYGCAADLLAAGVSVSDAHALKMLIAAETPALALQEKDLKARLEFVAEGYYQRGWTGEKSLFADGWQYGCRQRFFQAKVADETLPSWMVDQYSFMAPALEVKAVYAIDPDRPGVDLEGDSEPFEGD
jgi:hypothetical protein